MTHFFGIIFVPSARETARPALARKFFASSAQNLALSLRFSRLSDAKVGAKGRLGALLKRKCRGNVDEVWTKMELGGGFGRLSRMLARVSAKRGTRPDPLPAAATLSDRLSPSTGVPLLAQLGHFFDLWRQRST
jgi:hypothetical protein